MKKLGLSFDGGGSLIKGVARYMGELNLEYDESFLTGTSAGSIVVALRAVGKTWKEIDEIISKNIDSIFETSPWYWRYNPLKPKYQNKNLKNLLKKYLGNFRLSDSKKAIYICVSDFGKGKPKVFDNTDDEYLWKAVLCSCSAPTYFPPVDSRYCDGGLWANNPTMYGVAGYMGQYGVDIDDIKILSLGTNGDYWRKISIGENMNVLQWARPIITFSMYCTEYAGDAVARKVLKPEQYMRIEPKLPKDFQLDCTGKELNEYVDIWLNILINGYGDLAEWFTEW